MGESVLFAVAAVFPISEEPNMIFQERWKHKRQSEYGGGDSSVVRAPDS